MGLTLDISEGKINELKIVTETVNVTKNWKNWITSLSVGQIKVNHSVYNYI